MEPLSYADVVRVIEQYKQLQGIYNVRHNTKRRGHINITGGEPFIHRDIRQILAYLGENRQAFSYGILSNGSFLDGELIDLLKKTQVSFVQLSIDGDRQTHDHLRAPGDYDRVFATAQRLEKAGIPTYISFTANRSNYKHLPEVAAQCRKRKITKLWSDRLVPIGNGQQLRELAIGPDILEDYLRVLKKARGGLLTRLLHPKTQVRMNRALQFLGTQGQPYSCSAGDSLITVDEFGNIMPCRRMPILCGNVFDSTLEQVYYGQETFQKLRQQRIPKACAACRYVSLCRGGARCQSYALHGSFYGADPGCPNAK